MYGWSGGFGDTPPIMPGMVDCGGGLSVRQGTACPVITPIDLNDPRAKQAQADYNARAARCKVYDSKEYALDAAVGLAVAFLLPGAWKLLAIPAAVLTEMYYPRSVDCDYGF